MAVCRRGVHSMSSMRVPYTPLMLCCLTKRFTLLMPLAMSRGMLLSTCTGQTERFAQRCTLHGRWQSLQSIVKEPQFHYVHEFIDP